LKVKTEIKREELKHSMGEELQRFGKEFYETGKQCLTQRRKTCADNEGDFVDN
jgi:hypothetical protein